MNLAPFLTLHQVLNKFLNLKPSTEQLLELQHIYRLYTDLDLRPMYTFYRQSSLINESCTAPNIDCPVGEFELELFTQILIIRLTSKAKRNIELYECKLDEITKRINYQINSINTLITYANNPDRLRLYYRIPPNWLHAQNLYEHLFYFKDDDEHYSCFNVHVARDSSYSHTSILKHKDSTQWHYNTWATKLIWPEDYI